MEAYQYDIYSQTINETHKEAEYEEFNGEYIIKNESRSSILSKIQFMSMYWNYTQGVEYTCLVIDTLFSKLNLAQKLLSDMFPNVDFTFLSFPKDMEEYKKSADESIFTESMFENYIDIQNILLISDFETEKKANYDFEMNLQKTWYEKIKPNHALLKFAPDVDKGFYSYMRGVVYWKIYASSQYNLYNYIVPSKKIVSWNIEEYVKTCNYHNRYERNYPFWVIDNLGIQDAVSDTLKNDFDSITEIYIIYLYLRRFRFYNEIITHPKKVNEKEERIEYIEDPIKILNSLKKISERILQISNSGNLSRDKLLLEEIKNIIEPEEKVVEVENFSEESTNKTESPVVKKAPIRKSTAVKKSSAKNNVSETTSKPVKKAPVKKVPVRKSAVQK